MLLKLRKWHLNHLLRKRPRSELWIFSRNWWTKMMKTIKRWFRICQLFCRISCLSLNKLPLRNQESFQQQRPSSGQLFQPSKPCFKLLRSCSDLSFNKPPLLLSSFKLLHLLLPQHQFLLPLHLFLLPHPSLLSSRLPKSKPFLFKLLQSLRQSPLLALHPWSTPRT